MYVCGLSSFCLKRKKKQPQDMKTALSMLQRVSLFLSFSLCLWFLFLFFCMLQRVLLFVSIGLLGKRLAREIQIEATWSHQSRFQVILKLKPFFCACPFISALKNKRITIITIGYAVFCTLDLSPFLSTHFFCKMNFFLLLTVKLFFRCHKSHFCPISPLLFIFRLRNFFPPPLFPPSPLNLYFPGRNKVPFPSHGVIAIYTHHCIARHKRGEI